ncbi:translation elongation factor Ts [Sediminitomix flava]|uniref:Elongation factor Ts n=1 Tax=Sediminitomix flava TaxID=379075 RepID=A0A315Z5K2_SEDFL|nr:translation elongation factor Ts [Sediminitomix flava]PWJ39127.1 elongation factor Ts [Sediminitomix flava]
MAITAKDVQALRKATGAGMMDCKKALQEAEGNMDAAIEILRKKGQKVAAKRADNETTEGAVFSWNNDTNTEVIVLALACETEPVAVNENFAALGNMILQAAVASKAATSEELLAIEVEGHTVNEHIVELTGKMGEKITIAGYAYVTGEAVAAYLHGRAIAVAVELAGANNDAVVAAGKDVAMQVAAMNPLAVDESGVDAEVLEKEKQIAREKAAAEGKPEAILDRIAEGNAKKFLKDNTLLAQEFVKGSNKETVAQYLGGVASGLTVKSFVRVSTGR